jgi:hypothetical protein
MTRASLFAAVLLWAGACDRAREPAPAAAAVRLPTPEETAGRATPVGPARWNEPIPDERVLRLPTPDETAGRATPVGPARWNEKLPEES